MRYLQFVLILTAWLYASPAFAQAEPRIGPAPDWIVPVSIPEPNPAQRDRPFQTLLLSSQVRFEPDAQSSYSEMVLLVQSAQGMQGLGTIALPWQPENSELIVHRAHIIRNGMVIDLLAGGRRFTVARRESGLDSAMLDGVHTAVMQADGLSIGDRLDVAFTIRRRAGALPLRGENFYMLPYGFPVRHLYARVIWPTGIQVGWRATGVLERRPRERRTSLGNELLLDVADVEGTQPPAMAPPRFQMPSTLQVTAFRDWAEISAQFAPHYARAATLAADSPLRAKIAEIAASTSDPGARAMAALRLVQDEVRYFAVTIGDSGYLPATADETWTRRYGDCKGKTALLLALLRELGIDAEPVLVNSALGDALPDRLPQLGMFDHVIVRATIGGRPYWLDGTRIGNRQLEALASSRFGWGLPLRAAGTGLERLPFAPAAEPVVETRIIYDGSHGLLGEVAFSGSVIMRGEYAATMRAALTMAGETEFTRQAREWVPGGDDQGIDIAHEADERLGTFTLRFSGRHRMEWSGSAQSRAVTFGFAREPMTWSPQFARPGDRESSVPFWVNGPGDSDYIETVILPDGGRGFTLTGEAIDQTIAGVRFRRTVTMEDGRAVARSSVRQVALEIPRAEALASNAALTRLAEDRASVRGTPGEFTRGDRAALADREPVSANDFVERGFGFLQRGELDRATADFQRAATLRPEWSRPLANQAVVLLRQSKLDEADAMVDRAAALDANDFVVSQARGVAQLMRNRPVQAVAALTRSLELEPGNTFTLGNRAEAYQRLGEFDDALADFNTILERSPQHPGALYGKARILVWRGDAAGARPVIDAFAPADSDDPARLQQRGIMLRELGQNEAAAAAFRRALAQVETISPPAGVPAGQVAAVKAGMRAQLLSDSGDPAGAVREISVGLQHRPNEATLLNSRCWARATGNIELPLALADCDRALVLSPNNPAYLDSRAMVKLRLGRVDDAIADATAALAAEPLMAPSLYVRAVAHMRKGDRASADRDLAAARRLTFDIDLRYRRFGVTP
jgi:tetratricopeptide (TPR) repeat protein